MTKMILHSNTTDTAEAVDKDSFEIVAVSI